MKRVVNGLLLVSAGIFSCTVNRAKIDDGLKQYFDARKLEGCFAMLNNIDGKIIVYNLTMDTARYSPASTFKIVNSLIGLETGKILNDTMTIKWDGVKRWNDDWNKDLTMREAFRVSAVPYYQEVARRIGRDTMQRWLDSLHYGNMKIGSRIDSFWLDNSLKVSPDEQLGLVKKLYFDQLPFRKSVQQSVRNVMLREDNTAYKLSYKTGLGQDGTGADIGWAVGYIEENNHPYFFVTMLRSAGGNAEIRDARLGITKDILRHYGFFQGKK